MQTSSSRILYVEDHEDSCQAMAALLGVSGYEVTPIGSVAEALRLARVVAFDLYLLDNQLPDGSGVELCRQLRALTPATPIIFLSGTTLDADRGRALEAGAQAFLSKPCDLDDLELTLSQLVGYRQASHSPPEE